MATIFDIEYNGYHHHHQHRNRRSRRLRRHWNDYRIQLMKTETFFFFASFIFREAIFYLMNLFTPHPILLFGSHTPKQKEKKFPGKKTKSTTTTTAVISCTRMLLKRPHTQAICFVSNDR